MPSIQPTTLTPSEIVERCLRAAPLFHALPPPLLHDFSRGAIRKRAKRGESLWREGDAATAFVLLTAGLVKIVQRAGDPHAAIIGVFGPREAIGTVALLRRANYPAAAVAASAVVEYLRLDPAPVFAAMQSDLAVAQIINGAVLANTGRLHDKISVMSAGGVPRRVAQQLLDLAERFGDELEDGTLSLPIALSRSELASLVGARVETTIRLLARWKKADLVSFDGHGAVLRAPEKLREIARGDADEGDG